MTLSDIATFSTAISGIAVTASLIYLALQTHQSVKHTKALIHQGRASRIVESLNAQLASDVVAAVIEGDGGVPSPEAVRQRQFAIVCSTYFVSLEDSYAQIKQGLMGDDAIRFTRNGVRQLLSRPGVNASWQQQKDPSSGFTRFVDELVAVAPTTPTEALVR